MGQRGAGGICGHYDRGFHQAKVQKPDNVPANVRFLRVGVPRLLQCARFLEGGFTCQDSLIQQASTGIVRKPRRGLRQQ